MSRSFYIPEKELPNIQAKKAQYGHIHTELFIVLKESYCNLIHSNY